MSTAIAAHPVEVSWFPEEGAPDQSWNVVAVCTGCQQFRRLHVCASVAQDPDLAESVERAVLAALHAPDFTVAEMFGRT